MFKFNFFYILLMSNIVMANTEIKIYTSSYPNRYKAPLKDIIWRDDKKEYYIKNINTPDRKENKSLQGIGLVIGDLDEQTREEYEYIKNKIFLTNKNSQNKYSRALMHKKLNVTYKNKDDIFTSYILYNGQDDEEKNIRNWYESKQQNFSTLNKYYFDVGFLIDSFLLKKRGYYILTLVMKNISDQEVVISGLNYWGNDKKNDHNSLSVRLSVGKDLNKFSFNLDKDNYIYDNESYYEKIVLLPRSENKIEFKIDEQDFEKMKGFMEENPNIQLEYSVILNLDIISPYIISGGFSYYTQFNIFK
jgi:hypothetical protein